MYKRVWRKFTRKSHNGEQWLNSKLDCWISLTEHIMAMDCLSQVFYSSKETPWPQQLLESKTFIGLLSSVVQSIIIMVGHGSVHADMVLESSTSYTDTRKWSLTLDMAWAYMRLQRVPPQWHISSNKATPNQKAIPPNSASPSWMGRNFLSNHHRDILTLEKVRSFKRVCVSQIVKRSNVIFHEK